MRQGCVAASEHNCRVGAEHVNYPLTDDLCTDNCTIDHLIQMNDDCKNIPMLTLTKQVEKNYFPGISAILH